MRFLLASAALGMIGFFASEAMFWVVPHADFSVPDQMTTLLAYMVCASVALFVVVRAGLQGVKAAFLGGAILGFLVEGAVVGTIYAAFPFQLAWTPLAWHGLISGGVVLGLGRCGARLGAARMALLWAALGAFISVFALYWPIEVPIPRQEAVLAYLVGLGLLVPLGHILLDRIGTLDGVPAPAVAVPAALLLAAWGVQGVVAADPMRLVLPLVLAGLCWIAVRLGDGAPLALGAKVSPWRHALFLIAPGIVVLLAPLGWAAFPGGVQIWPIAVLTGGAGLFWMGRMAWAAAR